jgi:hypothetical protein
LSKLEGFRELRSLSKMLPRALLLHADYRPELVSVPGVGSVLRVAPRTAMQFSLEGRPARLRLAFGVLAGDPANPEAANPVVFRVSALGEGGARVELWSRQINTSAQALGQDKQQAVVDLSEAKSSEIILETVPAGPEERGGPTCYWRQIEAEPQ